jgi:hypothetical protein
VINDADVVGVPRAPFGYRRHRRPRPRDDSAPPRAGTRGRRSGADPARLVRSGCGDPRRRGHRGNPPPCDANPAPRAGRRSGSVARERPPTSGAFLYPAEGSVDEGTPLGEVPEHLRSALAAEDETTRFAAAGRAASFCASASSTAPAQATTCRTSATAAPCTLPMRDTHSLRRSPCRVPSTTSAVTATASRTSASSGRAAGGRSGKPRLPRRRLTLFASAAGFGLRRSL